MGYNLLINGVYWGYNPLTNHLVTSWDIQAYETSFTMRGATGVIHQRHQVLRLPRKMTLMHDWCPSHMKRHLQCAEQQVSYTHVRLSWLMPVTYETSFTMRGATGITLQPHQILRLPRKMTLMTDVRHIWNVIYNARSNRCHTPTSQSTAPAT